MVSKILLTRCAHLEWSPVELSTLTCVHGHYNVVLIRVDWDYVELCTVLVVVLGVGVEPTMRRVYVVG
jgi:hypothetical protein